MPFSEWDFALSGLQSQHADASFCFSPLSLLLGLAMAHSGARTTTQKEISSIIFDQSEQSAVHNYYVSKFKGLQSFTSDKAVFGSINQIYIPQVYTIAPTFTALLQKDFGSKVIAIDASGKWKDEVKGLNSAIEKATAGEFKDFVPKDAVREDAVNLLNLMYFYGKWKEPFEKYNTKEDNFYPSAKVNRAAHFLKCNACQKEYSSDSEWEMLTLPYKNSEFLFHCLLPKERFGLASALKTLNPSKITNLIKNRKSVTLNMKLPKFNIDTNFDPKTFLQKKGAKSMFDSKTADFSGMTKDSRLYVEKIVHRTKIALDEESTKAASVTVVQLLAGMSPFTTTPPPIVFNADHPFLFAISANVLPVFFGRISGNEFMSWEQFYAEADRNMGNP